MGYKIELEFLNALSPSRQAVFAAAKERWSRVIENDQPPGDVAGRPVEGLLIYVRTGQIDNEGNVVARSEPRQVRPGTFVPVMGEMLFDEADLDLLEAGHTPQTGDVLLNTVFHEMGHVLGIGATWTRRQLLAGADTVNPGFLGPNAMREYAALAGLPAPAQVPVENSGLGGTGNCHWRELVFGNEMMTGFAGLGARPLSRLTIASLQDIGYTVDFSAADDYALPSHFELAAMGAHADPVRRRSCSLCRPHPAKKRTRAQKR